MKKWRMLLFNIALMGALTIVLRRWNPDKGAYYLPLLLSGVFMLMATVIELAIRVRTGVISSNRIAFVFLSSILGLAAGVALSGTVSFHGSPKVVIGIAVLQLVVPFSAIIYANRLPRP